MGFLQTGQFLRHTMEHAFFSTRPCNAFGQGKLTDHFGYFLALSGARENSEHFTVGRDRSR
jgi:hypothetical protein